MPHLFCLKGFNEGVIIVAAGFAIEHDANDAKHLLRRVIRDALVNQMKLQVVGLPSYGVLRWCMQVELEEVELVHVPVSINEDELARAITFVEITLHGIVEGAIVHYLALNRLLPHPDLHVFGIDQMAPVLLSGHWNVDG